MAGAHHRPASPAPAWRSCKVAQDLKGESKGYGFVHYEKDESARMAIEKVNGMLLEGKKVFVGAHRRRRQPGAATCV